MTVMEHTSQKGAYLGTLGFTKPLEQLVLRTMPLPSLLDWLSKPKGPTLVEASVKAAPYKALAIAVTKRMLYGEKPPLVGVGLVYKLHYISTMLFSAAYMHLNVWHSAGSKQGVREPVRCTTPPVCGHLRDEQCHTCHGTTSCLIGCDI